MIRTISRLLPVAALFVGATLVLAACESTEEAESQPAPQEASMGMINDTCPMSGEPVDPNADTVAYMGNTVGLCCNGCVASWNKWSDDQKADYIAQHTK